MRLVFILPSCHKTVIFYFLPLSLSCPICSSPVLYQLITPCVFKSLSVPLFQFVCSVSVILLFSLSQSVPSSPCSISLWYAFWLLIPCVILASESHRQAGEVLTNMVMQIMSAIFSKSVSKAALNDFFWPLEDIATSFKRKI